MASLSLAFDILARDKNASKTFKEVGDSAEKAGKQGAGFGDAIKRGIGVAAGAIAAAGIGNAIKDAVGAASDLSETINASNVIFGANAGKIQAWSKTAARSFGLSRESALEAATGLGNMLTQLGYTGEAATQASTDTVKLAADLGSFRNLPTEDVLDRISAAMRGEYDSLQLLIPNINASRVETEALAMTGKKSAKELTAQEKAAATLAIINRDGAAAAGDFAETQDGLANSTKIAKAQFDDLKAALGAQFLPIVTNVMGYITDTALPAVSNFVAEMESGEGAGGKFKAGLDNVRDGLLTVKDIAGQTFDVLFRGDFTGGPLDEDSKFVATLFNIRDAFMAVRDFIRDEVTPRFGELKDQFNNDVKPALATTHAFLVEKFQPTWEELVDVYNQDIRPAVDDLRAAFERNKPELEQIAKLVGLVAEATLIFHAAVASKLYPLLIDLAGLIGGEVLREFGQLLDVVGGIVSGVQSAWEWFGKFMDRISQFKVPGWISGMGGAVGNIAGALTGAVGALAGAGDGPGRYAGGGNTLAKVRGLLPPGAQITSTYRTPAQNAAVGGVTGSYHTDRGNPAVDIAGSRAAMDAVYARLVQIGGWRELLYKVPGHWDHVHVAHQGGTVSSGWPSMPGLRHDERPVIAQVGEQIIAKGASVPGGSGGPVYLADESVGALASAILAGVGMAAHQSVAGYASLNRRAGVYA